MSVSIATYSYNFDQLITLVMSHCKTDKYKLVENILLSGGTVIGERYLILDNEYWEDYNSYYNVSAVLDEVFEVNDTFGNCFCCSCSMGDKKEITPSLSCEEIKKGAKISE